MRWFWQKRPPLPAIPPSPYHAPVSIRETPKEEPGIAVEEHDADEQDMEALRAAQTRTGMFRVWDRVTGKFKDPPEQ